MTTQYITVEIGTQSCARGRVFNGRGLVRGYNGRWLDRRDDGHINMSTAICFLTQLILLTMEELFPFSMPLNIHQ